MELCNYIFINLNGRLIYIGHDGKIYEVLGFVAEGNNDPTFKLYLINDA